MLFYNQGLSAEILLILILLAAFTIVYRTAWLFRKHSPTSRFFEEISSATSQIKLRGSLVPDNDTLLRENDTLTIVGSSERLKKSMRIFHPAGE